MINSTEQYLSLLKKSLNGCDRATIQDALSDAEEHLRTALNSVTPDSGISEVDNLTKIIEKYGTPEEISAAYRQIEHHITPALSQVSDSEESEKQDAKDERPFLTRFFGVFADTQAWGAFLYLMFSLLTGIFYFTWVVTGISLSAGLMVLIIGLPFAGLFILSVRGISLIEGRIVEALLGIRMPRRPIFHRKNKGWWALFKSIISGKHTWLSIVYMILQLPLGIIYFTVLVTLIAISLYGIASPILQLGIGLPFSYINGVSYYLANWFLPIAVIAGILLATLTMNLAKYVGRKHGAMAKALLVRF